MNITDYVADVNAVIRRGGVGEHSVRQALLEQLRQIAHNVEAINEPGATEHGNPDISVYRSAVPIGWVETKSLSTSLDVFEGSDQFDRYLRGFANLLVTNFNEFRWYVDHNRRPLMVARVGAYVPDSGLVTDDPSLAARVPELVAAFCAHESRQARSAAELAQRLAVFAAAVRQTVTGILERRDDDVQLRQELDAFRTVLIPDLSEADFADMYAQMVAYGLFAARCAHPDFANFDRLSAPQLLPVSNPFLRNVFGNLAGVNLDVRVSGLLDQVCLLLRTADLDAIVEEFRSRTGLADPVVHFYETFLQTYDRELRKDRGVYYTPISIVSFIVRSVDEILKRELQVRGGLADQTKVQSGEIEVHQVQVLDPATGTGTFLLYLTDFLRKGFGRQLGLWTPYVHEELLPRMYGFEYLMAPYAIAHLKVGMALAGQGFEFHQHERLGIFLTNTLEDTAEAVGQLPFQNFLTVEAEQANAIKQQRPIMVVIGNPPWSVRTGNLGPNARRLVSGYTRLDGEPIREGGTLALQRSVENDYVKFLAFAEEQITRTGKGVVGYVTANGYLDQPTLAGLRRSLMTSFDEIRVIDLHGYARAGTGDENVFSQIAEGVAIILLVRREGNYEREAIVRYHSRRGNRASKRGWLAAYNVYEAEFEEVAPTSPDYRFRPEDPAIRARYRGEFVGLHEIFALQKGAIVTARDGFAIGFSESELIARLEAFRDHRGPIRQASDAFGLSWKGDWPDMAEQAREWLRHTHNLREHVRPITYRPFDDRYVIYSDRFLDTPCTAVMDHMAGRENRLLLFGRSVRYGLPDQFFVTNKLAEAKSAEASRQCHAAPLYLHDGGLIERDEPNFTRTFLARSNRIWGGSLSESDIFAYIYAILNSNAFREAYADQLCADYARVPIMPTDVALQVSLHGQRLINLHVLDEMPELITEFPVAAAHTTIAALPSSRRWRAGAEGRQLWLNDDQYVGGIPDEVQTMRIGGYPVIDKWITGRVGRTLSLSEVVHLQRVMAVLAQSIEEISEVDRVIGDLIHP